MTTYQISQHERSLLAAGALASDLASTPRLLTTLTDEELLALTGPDRPGERHPWIDGLRERVSGYGMEEAVLTGARSLRARGLTAPEAALAPLESRARIGEGSAVRAGLVVTGIIARRAVSRRRLTVGRESDPRGFTTIFYADIDGSVLQEQVSADGLHHFLIQDLESALRALRSLLEDDDEHVGEGGDGDEGGDARSLVSGGWEEVSTALGIAAQAAVRRLDLVDRSDEAEETLWVAASPLGPVVLRSTEGGDAHALTRTVLEASSMSLRERDELLEEILTGGLPRT